MEKYLGPQEDRFCGIDKEGNKVYSCKECIYDGFENKEKCHKRQYEHWRETIK